MNPEALGGMSSVFQWPRILSCRRHVLAPSGGGPFPIPNVVMSMKPSSPQRSVLRPQHAPSGRSFHLPDALARSLFFVMLATSACSGGEEPPAGDPAVQVLARGPVHEAFADIVRYDSGPGPIVGKLPPEDLREIPPSSRPDGDDISWIPGYWAWDDEIEDFLWVSGTWRVLPPERRWNAGYWSAGGMGYRWCPGFWENSSLTETIYLPPPPASREAGPDHAAPSPDHVWIPGVWRWENERYGWNAGYWAAGRSDWDWIPAHYVWTPRGHVFVDGYWDHGFGRRGVLYAPVYFRSGCQSRPAYRFSPVVALGLLAVMEHLFLRPDHHHYYFGDYYERRYRDGGYLEPHAYQGRNLGYDPVYVRRVWEHRGDGDWERRQDAIRDYRREHESARPPRLWDEQKKLSNDGDVTGEHRLLIGSASDRMSGSRRFQRVSENEKRRITELEHKVRTHREARRLIETRDGANALDEVPRGAKPTTAKVPASPVVGRPRERLDENQAPPSPHRASEARGGKDGAAERGGGETRREEHAKPVPAQDHASPKDRPGVHEGDKRGRGKGESSRAGESDSDESRKGRR